MVRKLSIFIFKLLALVITPSGKQEGAVALPEVSTIRPQGSMGSGTRTARTGAEWASSSQSNSLTSLSLDSSPKWLLSDILEMRSSLPTWLLSDSLFTESAPSN